MLERKILNWYLFHCFVSIAVCYAAVVDSVASAQTLRGCTVIEGYLEIQIRGGSKLSSANNIAIKSI